MKITPAGIALIKQFESCVLKAYKCPAGIWTIGYGHTGPEVHEGLTISKMEAGTLLNMDLEKFDRAVLLKCPTASPEQHSAMVCLAFNIGIGAFNKSSVARNHNAGNFNEAAQSFALWNKAGGKVLAGLVKRRAAEAALYLQTAVAKPDEPEPVNITAEGEKPLTQSKTMIGSVGGGTAIAASQVADAMNQIDWLKEQLYALSPYLPVISKALILLGVLGFALAAYARWKDRREGRA